MGWGSQTFVYFAKNLSRVKGGEWYWVLITGCISIVLWDASLILWVASLHPPSLFSHPSFASDDAPPINSQLFRLRLRSGTKMFSNISIESSSSDASAHNCFAGFLSTRILLYFPFSSLRPSQAWHHTFSPVYDDLDKTNHAFSINLAICCQNMIIIWWPFYDDHLMTPKQLS